MNNFKQDDREYFDAVCNECQQPTKVPFKPIQGRPIFCKNCYKARKPSSTY